jgi:hypothetical protein
MQNKAKAMHNLLALANANLATWVNTGNDHALLQGIGAAHALVAHNGYANLANHDTGLPGTPNGIAWHLLSDLVHLTCSGAIAVDATPPPRTLPPASSFAHQLALQIEELDDLPWLFAVRGSTNGQAKPGA